MGFGLPVSWILGWCQKRGPFPRDLADSSLTGVGGGGKAGIAHEAGRPVRVDLLRLPKWPSASGTVHSALVTRWQVLNK